MFRCLCLLLIVALGWQYSSSRHLSGQHLYLPYTDYSYTYSGPGPLYHQQQHSQSFSPPGTYYDQRQGILRPFPGGGVPVLVDYHKRCSNQYVGVKSHPNQPQYYYVCKPDSVIFGKCQNLQVFNATNGQCVQHPPPEYIPTCTGIGRFPLFSDCHLYYKCEEDLHPKIYSCPVSMIFSPTSKKCINGNHCTPTQISPHSTYISEGCASKFPPCFENGIFRSPSDCSLYYKCDLKNNGFYMQTRLRCGQGNFYDLQKNMCSPAKEVSCDCIQVAELVYPKPHTMHFQPAVYPAQFDLDSLDEGHYPVEQTKDDVQNSYNISDSRNNTDPEPTMTTTLDTALLENGHNNEQNSKETAVLSDYIDIADNNTAISEKLEALTQIQSNSEESASTEDISFETVSEENENTTTESQSVNKMKIIMANLIQEMENITETATTENSDKLTENTANNSTEEPINGREIDKKTTSFEMENTVPSKEFEQREPFENEIININNIAEVDTTTPSKEVEQEETTTAKVSTRSIKSPEHLTKKDSIKETDTQNEFPKLPKFTTTNFNTDSEPIQISFKNTIHEQNTNAIDLRATKQLPSTKSTSADDKPSNNLISTLSKKSATENLQTTQKLNVIGKEMQMTENPILVKLENPPQLVRKTTESDQMILQNSTQEIILTSLGKQLAINRVEVEEPEITTIRSYPVAQNKTTFFDGTTDNPDDELIVSDFDITTNNSEISTLNANSLLDDELLPINPSLFEGFNQEHTFTNAVPTNFNEEELIPVHSVLSAPNESQEKDTVFGKRFDIDFTTAPPEKDFTTTTSGIMHQEENTAKTFQTNLRRRQVTIDKSTELKPIKTLPTRKLFSDEPNTTSKFDLNSHTELLDPLQPNIHGQSEEAINNEVTSSEIFHTTLNSQQKQFSYAFHTGFFTHTNKNITSTPSEKQATKLTLHVRQPDHGQASLKYTPIGQSLYCSIKTTPVINNNVNKSNSETVTAKPTFTSDHGDVPRLEIIAERPIDVHFSICNTACDKKHTHINSSIGKRAVLLKWFANKSKQTLGFETANEVDADAY